MLNTADREHEWEATLLEHIKHGTIEHSAQYVAMQRTALAYEISVEAATHDFLNLVNEQLSTDTQTIGTSSTAIRSMLRDDQCSHVIPTRRTAI